MLLLSPSIASAVPSPLNQPPHVTFEPDVTGAQLSKDPSALPIPTDSETPQLFPDVLFSDVLLCSTILMPSIERYAPLLFAVLVVVVETNPIL